MKTKAYDWDCSRCGRDGQITVEPKQDFIGILANAHVQASPNCTDSLAVRTSEVVQVLKGVPDELGSDR